MTTPPRQPVTPRTSKPTVKTTRRPLKVLLATASLGAVLGGWAAFSAGAPPVTAAPPPAVIAIAPPTQDPLAGLPPLPPVAALPDASGQTPLPTAVPAPVAPAAPARRARPAPVTTTRSS